MDSEKIENSFKQVIEETMIHFETIRREIRISKAAILKAEYRLNLCEKRFKSTVTSLKEDMKILIELHCTNDADDFDIGPESDINITNAQTQRDSIVIPNAEIGPFTSTPKCKDAKDCSKDDSGLELSRADADGDEELPISKRRKTRKRKHAYLDD